jgi:hypothetical protein
LARRPPASSATLPRRANHSSPPRASPSSGPLNCAKRNEPTSVHNRLGIKIQLRNFSKRPIWALSFFCFLLFFLPENSIHAGLHAPNAGLYPCVFALAGPVRAGPAINDGAARNRRGLGSAEITHWYWYLGRPKRREIEPRRREITAGPPKKGRRGCRWRYQSQNTAAALAVVCGLRREHLSEETGEFDSKLKIKKKNGDSTFLLAQRQTDASMPIFRIQIQYAPHVTHTSKIQTYTTGIGLAGFCTGRDSPRMPRMAGRIRALSSCAHC